MTVFTGFTKDVLAVVNGSNGTFSSAEVAAELGSGVSSSKASSALHRLASRGVIRKLLPGNGTRAVMFAAHAVSVGDDVQSKIHDDLMKFGPSTRTEIIRRMAPENPEAVRRAIRNGVSKNDFVLIDTMSGDKFGIPTVHGAAPASMHTKIQGSTPTPRFEAEDAPPIEGVRCVKVETKPMTHELAAKFANMTQTPGERPLTAVRSKELEYSIRRTPHAFGWAQAYVRTNPDLMYRVDGNTSSHVLWKKPDLIKHGMKAVISTYECETLADVADLYSTFDLQKRSRTVAHINKCYVSTNTRFDGISGSVVNIIIAGHAMALYGSEYGKRTHATTRVKEAMTEEEFVLMAGGMMSGSRTSPSTAIHLRRVAVVAVMFMTWSKDKKACKEFWADVASGDNPNDFPDRVLHNWLRSVKSSPRNSDESASDREVITKCIHAWNAFREGRALKKGLVWFKGTAIPKIQ